MGKNKSDDEKIYKKFYEKIKNLKFTLNDLKKIVDIFEDVGKIDELDKKFLEEVKKDYDFLVNYEQKKKDKKLDKRDEMFYLEKAKYFESSRIKMSPSYKELTRRGQILSKK